MSHKLKIGLDIHGVSDSNVFFKEMAKVMTAAGHEIHIITGAANTKAIRDLSKIGMINGVHYHCIFSITDQLIKEGIEVEWRDPSNPVFPDEEWNQAKAIYCCKHQITVHFDDTKHYGDDFVTPFAHYTAKSKGK